MQIEGNCMREATLLERILNWFRNLFVSKEKRAAQDEQMKREMCHKAIDSGVCPKACEICAWDTFHKRTGER